MKYIFTFILATFVFSTMYISNASALRADDQCKNIEVIFARGSGQRLNDEDAPKFYQEISKRITNPSKISFSFYQLGTETYGGHKYPAEAVGGNSWTTGLGAKFSNGMGNKYGKSVDSGVGELYTYLTKRYEKCKSTNTKFILGGYSQGAQVVGQTLPKFTTELRSSILYTAFFGDPKLHLPEGEGWNPPACQGKSLSAYRRVIANCNVDNGSLGARKPYLPTDMTVKSGLWCYEHDYVCGVTHSFTDNAGHSTYRNDGLAIDHAALEIATRLKENLPFGMQDAVDTKPRSTASGQPDVVYIVDTTGSMGNRIEQAKQYVRNASAQIQALHGRVALIAYRDLGDEYTAKVITPFTSDLTQLRIGLDSLSVGGGGDYEEAALHAAMTAFNQLEWRNGATKSAVILTDAPFHSPDKVDGSTMATVTKRSLEIDPVNIYPVVPAEVANAYTELATQTSGQVITDTGDTEAALVQALTKIQQRPVALLKNTLYRGEPGQEFTFDASDSFIVDASITRYEWDFDGDGVFETTTTAPTAAHIYTQKFDGIMQVRLHGSNGTIANASAFVKVGTYVAPALPTAPTTVSVTPLSTAADGTSAVRLAWSGAASDKWVIAINGTVAGNVTGSQTSIEISSIDRSMDTVFAVAGLRNDGTFGEYTSALLEKSTTAPPSSQPCLFTGLATIFNTLFRPFITITISC